MTATLLTSMEDPALGGDLISTARSRATILLLSAQVRSDGPRRKGESLLHLLFLKCPLSTTNSSSSSSVLRSLHLPHNHSRDHPLMRNRKVSGTRMHRNLDSFIRESLRLDERLHSCPDIITLIHFHM